ncbi:hypothetical protein GE09DRAFT_1142029 [Coniochaeta sp. 2T2.1]|nr:hypothetical protein GE09DRAFT_1142029 [Coniochaeta sp. 2T2.1]
MPHYKRVSVTHNSPPVTTPPHHPRVSRDEAMPADPTDLRNKYGLDDGLHYVPGTPVYRAYDEYKQSSRRAETARVRYDRAANLLRVPQGRELGDGQFPRGSSPYRMFFPEDHAGLLPLAEEAFRTARDHAEKREAFNVRYEKVLEAKGVC